MLPCARWDHVIEKTWYVGTYISFTLPSKDDYRKAWIICACSRLASYALKHTHWALEWCARFLQRYKITPRGQWGIGETIRAFILQAISSFIFLFFMVVDHLRGRRRRQRLDQEVGSSWSVHRKNAIRSKFRTEINWGPTSENHRCI